MKFLFVVIVLAAMAVFLTLYSFNSYFAADADYILPEPAPQEAPAEPASGGGSPRNPDHRPPASARPSPSSTPGGFRGPSGPPHIIGPSEPPPGSQ